MSIQNLGIVQIIGKFGPASFILLKPPGIWLARKTIPAEVMAESREQAQAQLGQDQPTRWMAAAVIIGIWLLIAAIGATLILRVIRG